MAVESHPEVERVPGEQSSVRGRSQAEFLTAYLGDQLANLRRNDPSVRAGVPDSVHRMRVAARRARSVLATYSTLLPGASDGLIVDLRWLGSVLGGARDAEVLRDRLGALLDDQPDWVAHGPLSRRLEVELGKRGEQGHADAIQLLGSDRYARLIENLDELVTSPQVAPDTTGGGPAEVARLAHRDWKRLRRRTRVAGHTSGGDERDRALHDVRTAAKRLRYAAESAVPVLGDPAEAMAVSCVGLQDALGAHHDSVSLLDLLGRVHEGVARSGAPDPALDRLRAREEQRAATAEQEYEAALDLLMRQHPAGWPQLAAQGPAAHAG
jgi:CHAD domain-containing protein